jgi:transcriptional regulator with XRE-family HTH domain
MNEKDTVRQDIGPDVERGDEIKSDLLGVVTLLYNEKYKRRKTRLRGRTIPSLTTVDTLAQIYDVEWLQYWIEGYTEFITSLDGKGRQEVVDIAKYSIDKQDKRDKQLIEMLGKR